MLQHRVAAKRCDLEVAISRVDVASQMAFRRKSLIKATTAVPLMNPHQARQGKRHAWNMLVGDMSAELLEWLRAETALQPEGLRADLGLTFEGRRIVGSSGDTVHSRCIARPASAMRFIVSALCGPPLLSSGTT